MIVNDLFESAYAGNTERAVARNMNRPVVDEQGVAEGEVVPFKRPQQQAITWKQLPKNVLRLANDWYWADQDDSGADAVMDPKGFGSGTANELKYITAKLQQEGWSIDYNDEHDAPGEYNLRLTNRRGQSVLLPIEDAQDFTGWAKGTSSMTEQGVAEGLKEQVYKVVALDKSNALKKPTKLNVKASSIEDVFSRLAANDWYALSINGVEVVAGKRLKQGVAEVVHPDVTSKKYFIEPTENVRMGEFEFNARTFTGGLSDPNARGLQIRAYDPEQPKGQNLIGSTDFIVKSDKKGNQWLESDDTEVNDEYRGKGVAAMMYAFAKSLGNDIKSSPYQSQKGREMWRKWGTDAKHLAGKKGVAEGLDNTDDILQDLTSAYRTCVKHRDSYTNFGNIQTVYELLRDPLMKGDIAGYEKMHGYVAGKYPDAFDALMDEVSGEQGVAEGIFGSKENSAVPLVNKIAQVARQLTPQNVNVGKQIIQSNADDILRMMSPQAKTGIEVIEQGVAEAGPFSYGKAPRKGSIADLAAKKRKEQEQGKQPVEPKDQMVGVAKVKKGVAESINAMIKQATSREDLRQIRNFVAEHVTDVNRQRKIMEQATQIVAVQRRKHAALSAK